MLRYIEHDRERKPSTVAGYKALVRSQLLPAFGEQPIESITTPMIERWLAESRGVACRTKRLAIVRRPTLRSSIGSISSPPPGGSFSRWIHIDRQERS